MGWSKERAHARWLSLLSAAALWRMFDTAGGRSGPFVADFRGENEQFGDKMNILGIKSESSALEKMTTLL